MVPPAVPYIINGGQGGGCRGRGHWTVSSFITVCNQCPLTTVKGFPRRHRQVPVMTSRQGFTRLSVSSPAVGDVGTATASTRIRIDEHEWRLLNNWLHVCSGVTRAIGARRQKQWSSPRQKKIKIGLGRNSYCFRSVRLHEFVGEEGAHGVWKYSN